MSMATYTNMTHPIRSGVNCMANIFGAENLFPLLFGENAEKSIVAGGLIGKVGIGIDID